MTYARPESAQLTRARSGPWAPRRFTMTVAGAADGHRGGREAQDPARPRHAGHPDYVYSALNANAAKMPVLSIQTAP